MELIYIFHSCFVVRGDKFDLLFDYYKDASDQPVNHLLHTSCNPLYVFASHVHSDHFNPVIFDWKEQKKDIKYVLSDDILVKYPKYEENAVWLKKGETYHDKMISVQAFGSTDAGISFYVEAGGKKIFHAGDLNNWHWNEESTPQEIEIAEKQYADELADVSRIVQTPDVAMFPIDPRLGKDYCKGALQFLEAVHPKILAPMHFMENFDAAAAMPGAVKWTKDNESIQL
jgi:L-ascorbate metabolism protein UlaG (beta-lactamase superfamily)